MKIYSRLKFIVFLLLAANTIKSQSAISQWNDQFNSINVEKNKINFHHDFSIITSVENNNSKTFGMYSNYSNYKFSDRLILNTGIHLIKKQNNLPYLDPNPKVLYDMNLKYQLGKNSFISIQVGNLTYPLRSNRFLSINNVP
tara:strand:- start:1870 stop:2295 length:426 start_codon:yes stop_codon:yes gene_type:complete